MAGASAADVRSILSLPTQHNSTAGPSQPKKARKPEGVSRELYSLIGPSAPTIVVQPARPRFKQKPNLGSGSTRWVWRKFTNVARSDGLQLSHWAKANTPADQEYPFVKYNTKAPDYTYTSEEYSRLLTDNDWTREETDYLFNLIKEYDVRWYIVVDRYEYAGAPERSMEDLKDRYYSVCRKLVRNRPWTGDEASKQLLLSTLQFDKEREVTRKKYLDSLEGRNEEEIAEEEALYVELKRLEQNERRFKLEREDLLRTLLGVESGLANLPFEDEGPLGDPRKRKRTFDLDSPASATPPASGVPLSGKKSAAQSKQSEEYDAKHCIHRPDPKTIVPTKSAHNIAYLRSGKLPYPKQSVASKVSQILTELRVPQTRLVMPTRGNMVAYDHLIEAATALVDAKKSLDRVEHEIGVARTRLGLKDGQAGGGKSVSAETRAESPMEQDEEEGAAFAADTRERQASQRAESVVSTRSAHSRKQSTRRSMSVSSVDTTGTSTTRGGNKRQKIG